MAQSANLQTPDNAPAERWMGLDVGDKRIGIALTDELGLTVQPLMTLARTGSRREAIRSIVRLARRHAVTAIVVGLPLHASGQLSPQAEKTQAFAAELGEFSGLPIHLLDERHTSGQAHEILYQAGRKRQDHKEVVDQLAAVLILEAFVGGLEAGKPEPATGESEQETGQSLTPDA